jgi:hypothetical protein
MRVSDIFVNWPTVRVISAGPRYLRGDSTPDNLDGEFSDDAQHSVIQHAVETRGN